MIRKSILIVFACLIMIGAVSLTHAEENKQQDKSVASINTKMKSGDTPLMLAVRNNNIEVVKFLISKGADVNAVDGSGESALFSAVSNDNIPITKFLIKNGADVNIENHFYKTPLMVAINKNNKDMITLLTNSDRNDIQDSEITKK